MLKIPKFAKIAVFPKMTNFRVFLKIGKNAKNAKMQKMQKWPKYPKMAKYPKMGFLGKYPKIEILAIAVANTPGRLDVVIIFKTTPGYPFYILLLRVYILHYL